METSARFVLRHRWWVIGFWVIALLAGGVAAGKVPDRLSFDFSLPGQEGYETEVKLAEAYNIGAYAGYIPVLTAPDGEKITDHKAEVQAVADKIRAIPNSGVQVLDYAATGDERFVTDDGRSTFALVYAPTPQGFVDPLAEVFDTTVQAAAAEQGLTASVTGYNQLAAGSEDSDGPSVLVETLIGGLGAFIVLVFVFASFLAFVP